MSREPTFQLRAISIALVASLLLGPLGLGAHAHADEAPPSPPESAPVEPTPTPSPTPAPTPAVNLSPPPSPPPKPTTLVTYKRPHTGMLTAGLVLFVGGWVADIGFTYGYDHQPATTSLIPIAGPFIQMTESYGLDGPAIDTGNADADARITKNLGTANSTIRGLALTGAVFSAVLQLTGLALTIAGAAVKRKVVVRSYALGPGGLVGTF